MGKFCSVLYCDSVGKKVDGITMHRFPCNNPKLLAKWKLLTGRDRTWKPSLGNFVCSVHFDPSCFIDGPSLRRLKDNSYPTRIKLTNTMKKRQPMQYAYIKRTLLNQPGVTNVNKNDVVVCEFDEDVVQSFITTSNKKKKKKSKDAVNKRKTSEETAEEITEETSKEVSKETAEKASKEIPYIKESSDEEMDEKETDIIWDVPIKEEVDPLQLDSPPDNISDTLTEPLEYTSDILTAPLVYTSDTMTAPLDHTPDTLSTSMEHTLTAPLEYTPTTVPTPMEHIPDTRSVQIEQISDTLTEPLKYTSDTMSTPLEYTSDTLGAPLGFSDTTSRPLEYASDTQSASIGYSSDTLTADSPQLNISDDPLHTSFTDNLQSEKAVLDPSHIIKTSENFSLPKPVSPRLQTNAPPDQEIITLASLLQGAPPLQQEQVDSL